MSGVHGRLLGCRASDNCAAKFQHLSALSILDTLALAQAAVALAGEARGIHGDGGLDCFDAIRHVIKEMGGLALGSWLTASNTSEEPANLLNSVTDLKKKKTCLRCGNVWFRGLSSCHISLHEHLVEFQVQLAKTIFFADLHTSELQRCETGRRRARAAKTGACGTNTGACGTKIKMLAQH